MIFARFMAIYGHKFKSCFETEHEIRLAKREWALSLGSYSEAELVAAVNRCKETLAWMPSISEFLNILRSLQGDFGLPSTYKAYTEACFHAHEPSVYDWSHPAVYFAGQEVGWFRLRAEEEGQVYPAFQLAYEQLCRRVRQGESLHKPVHKGIEDKRDTTTALLIAEFAQEQDVSPELAATLLFYLTKPKGSRVRERFREQSIAKVQSLGLNLDLPV